LGTCSLGLAACASTAPSETARAANDPFEAFNRQTLARNMWVDRNIVVPAVRQYQVWVPAGGQRGIHNLLGNLAIPTIFVNDILQGEARRAGQSAARLVINSSLGLGGLFDPAAPLGIPAHGEDFGQTLAVWGVPEGPYLVLPFFGPSNPRDASGIVVDAVIIDPTNYIRLKQHIWWDAGREYFTLMDLRAATLDTIEGVERSSVDYYAALRSLYRQVRAGQIGNGRSPKAQDLPDF
jgi:phospholipid-binding lipoprotein MlaA